jgi:hypothetical protein
LVRRLITATFGQGSHARKVGAIAVALLAVSSGMGLGVLAIYRAARHEPEFYQQALQATPGLQARASDALERNLLELHNDARQQGRWQAVFTEEQINGWLATELPEKFPMLLPPGTQDPRVDVAPQRAQVACRYEQGNFSAVISFALDIALTDETNQLAIRVHKLRAGAIPVPLRRFLERIASAAHRAEIDLSWRQTEGDPVALVMVPVHHEDYAHREIYLETVELRDGEVFLAGRTEEAANQLLARQAPLPPADDNQSVQR